MLVLLLLGALIVLFSDVVDAIGVRCRGSIGRSFCASTGGRSGECEGGVDDTHGLKRCCSNSSWTEVKEGVLARCCRYSSGFLGIVGALVGTAGAEMQVCNGGWVVASISKVFGRGLVELSIS